MAGTAGTGASRWSAGRPTTRATLSTFHFAPANGIPEDPVTGTAHAAVAVYLDREGLLPPGQRLVLTGEQGHAVNRQGVVTVEVLRLNGRISEVRIGGTAVIVARGEVMARPPQT